MEDKNAQLGELYDRLAKDVEGSKHSAVLDHTSMSIPYFLINPSIAD